MKAAVVGDRGVAVRDVPRPAPAPNDVLIRVCATSLNRADLLDGFDQSERPASGRRSGSFLALNAPARSRRSAPT